MRERTKTGKKAWNRRAVLICSTLAVLCPHCSAEQPDPETGSDLWTPEQVAKNQGIRSCVSCDEEFDIAIFGTAPVDRHWANKAQ